MIHMNNRTTTSITYNIWSNLYLILILSIFSSLSIDAQCDINHDEITTLENEFRLKSYSEIASLTSGENYFKIDEDSRFDMGFKKALWITAYDENDVLRVAANTVVTNGARDFVAGPVLKEEQSQSQFCEFYTRIWKVDREEIEQLRDDFDSGVLMESDIPIDIWEWPAIGNEALGEFMPEEEMAPFHDNNSNGIYDPLSGDYPIALEELSNFIPEQYVFTVYNDDIEHTRSDTDSLRMEFHQMDYLVDCEVGGPVDRSIFTRIRYVYKGADDLLDLKMGIWQLESLGCHLDDRLGVSVEHNATYVYNLNGGDQQNCVEDSEQIPAGDGALSTHIYLNNDIDNYMYHHFMIVGGFPIATYSPNQPIHYDNNLSNRWRDGSSVVQGGIGYDTMSMDLVDFPFSDFPTDTSGWSMRNVDAPFSNAASVTALHKKERISTGYTGHIDYADLVIYDREKPGYEIFEDYDYEVNVVRNTYLNIL